MHTGLSDTEERVSGDAPVNPFASANGAHLIALVLTAFDCGWSAFPTFPEARKQSGVVTVPTVRALRTKPLICVERKQKGRRFQ